MSEVIEQQHAIDPLAFVHAGLSSAERAAAAGGVVSSAGERPASGPDCGACIFESGGKCVNARLGDPLAKRTFSGKCGYRVRVSGSQLPDPMAGRGVRSGWVGAQLPRPFMGRKDSEGNHPYLSDIL